MDVGLTRAVANDNDSDGVRFQGSGAAQLRSVSASGNAGEQIRVDDDVVVTQVPPVT